MSEPNEIDIRLTALSRDELNIVAKKLQVASYRRKNKEELIAVLKDDYGDRLAGVLNVTWWDRHHNHVYGGITIASLVIALMPMFSAAQPMDCQVQLIKIVPDNANDVFDATETGNWKLVSEDERSTLVFKIRNGARQAVGLVKGSVIIERFSNPLKDKPSVVQSAFCRLMDHQDHHVATIAKLDIGETGTFPVNTVVAAESEIALTLWVRVIENDRPPVSFIRVKVRFYDDEQRYVDSEPVDLEIHSLTEDFATKPLPNL